MIPEAAEDFGVPEAVCDFEEHERTDAMSVTRHTWIGPIIPARPPADPFDTIVVDLEDLWSMR